VQGRVLIVAGSDSGGGAGIQADIKTVTALGGYAASAVTALTAQDTIGVHEVRPVEAAFVARQMELVLADIGADAIKSGMLHDAGVIDAVADVLDRMAPHVPLVLDPVMVAKGGRRLLDENAVAALKRRFVRRARVITPNLPEAEVLAERAIETREAMIETARTLLTLGCKAVLLKGGHLPGKTVIDALASADGIELFEYPRIETKNTHGTGCTLASAVATGLAQGLALRDAVARARAYVQEAIRTAPAIGHGHGPLNHGHTVRPFGLPK
jgi:hydroxymethylpyrimidine/phosphomethylpyrimidine kinase